MPMFIGLGHYSRTGKDTFANFLVTELKRRGVKAVKQPLAWKLKQVAYDLYKWAGHMSPEFYETIEGEKLRHVKLEPLGLTPVELWVRLGTNAVRDNVYTDTWAKYVTEKDYGNAKVVIVPDVRFKSEVRLLKQHASHLIKVVRPGFKPLNTKADMDLAGDYDWYDDIIGETGRAEDLHGWAVTYAAAIVTGAITRMRVSPVARMEIERGIA